VPILCKDLELPSLGCEWEHLTTDDMLELIPAFGIAARIAGAMMEVHSFSVSVRAGSGYISFLDIVVFNAFQASACDDLPIRSLAAQFTAARRRKFIIFLFFWQETSKDLAFLIHHRS